MASDRGKQQAYCKVAVRISASLTAGLPTTSVDMGKASKRIFKKITDFPRIVPHFLFQKLNMSDLFIYRVKHMTPSLTSLWISLLKR